MTILKRIKLLLITMLFFTISTMTFGQKLEPKKRITAPDHTVTSNITGKEYQLYISFPKSYSTKETISYPILCFRRWDRLSYN